MNAPIGPVARLRLSADLVLVALFASAAVQALEFAQVARYMPLFATTVGAVLALALFVRDLVVARRDGGDAVVTADVMDTAVLTDETLTPTQALGRASLQLCWLIGYALAISLLGVLPASALFVTVFLYTEGRMRLPFALLSSAVTVGVLMLVSRVMNLRWPETVWELFGS